MRAPIERLDYRIIYKIVEPGSRVLDLGCGSGGLLKLLAEEKQAIVQGIELDDLAIHACVEKGLSVFHSDIDSGLQEYPDKCFDYVILNQSMQQVKRIEFVIDEALRVGRRVIIGFPNFANIRSRLVLFFRGKAPMTSSLPYHWYDTPNLRFLSISDFREYCRTNKITILAQYCLGPKRQVRVWRNLRASNAVFMITRETDR
jgi:methionine biosynthesis protein MetW